jgi:hypothetical protein
MIELGKVATLHSLCPDAKLVEENGQQFIHLPALKIPVGTQTKTREALLCPSRHSGYLTRLFFNEKIDERRTIAGVAVNWSAHSILSRTWYTWSWQGVSADLPLLQMLVAHVKAFK